MSTYKNEESISEVKATNTITTDTEISETQKNSKEIPEKLTQPENKSVDITTKKYHVIGGAFRVSANATKKVRQLKAKGYDAQIVGINKWQLTEVAFGSFDTREEALIVLRKIRKSEEKGAWMLIK